MGCPLGRPTIYSATSARRCKTVNDGLGTRFVDILIRLVACKARSGGVAPAFPRDCQDLGATAMRTEFFLGSETAGIVPGAPGRWPHCHSEHKSVARTAHKKKGPRQCRSPLAEFTSRLGRCATVAGATTTQKSPKPTHVKSPVGTAHEEQLTERLPSFVR